MHGIDAMVTQMRNVRSDLPRERDVVDAQMRALFWASAYRLMAEQRYLLSQTWNSFVLPADFPYDRET